MSDETAANAFKSARDVSRYCIMANAVPAIAIILARTERTIFLAASIASFGLGILTGLVAAGFLFYSQDAQTRRDNAIYLREDAGSNYAAAFERSARLSAAFLWISGVLSLVGFIFVSLAMSSSSQITADEISKLLHESLWPIVTMVALFLLAPSITRLIDRIKSAEIGSVKIACSEVPQDREPKATAIDDASSKPNSPISSSLRVPFELRQQPLIVTLLATLWHHQKKLFPDFKSRWGMATTTFSVQIAATILEANALVFRDPVSKMVALTECGIQFCRENENELRGHEVTGGFSPIS